MKKIIAFSSMIGVSYSLSFSFECQKNRNMSGYEGRTSIYYYVYIYYFRFAIIKVPDEWVEYLCFVLFEIALDIWR